jgi:arylsulfatase A-like enzyme
LQFVDASVGQLVDALKQQGLFDCTYVIITAKHGQVRHWEQPFSQYFG